MPSHFHQNPAPQDVILYQTCSPMEGVQEGDISRGTVLCVLLAGMERIMGSNLHRVPACARPDTGARRDPLARGNDHVQQADLEHHQDWPPLHVRALAERDIGVLKDLSVTLIQCVELYTCFAREGRHAHSRYHQAITQ